MKPIYNEAMSSFFRNVESSGKKGGYKDLPVDSEMSHLKARAIIVDTEEGVINNKILNGNFKDLFDVK